MQTGRHCPHDKEVTFVSTHNRSCDLGWKHRLTMQGQVTQLHSATSTGVRNDVKEAQTEWRGCRVCVVHRVALIWPSFCHGLCAPPNKHTFTHTYRGIELASSLRWNKTVPSAENRATEGKKPAVLIGIPSSWSSWIQTLSHSELTQGTGRKVQGRRRRWGGGHIWLSTESWPDISSFSSASHSCPVVATLIATRFSWGRVRIKEAEGKPAVSLKPRVSWMTNRWKVSRMNCLRPICYYLIDELVQD